VFTLGDVYMLTWMPRSRVRKKFKWILYTPIDSAPIPLGWKDTLGDADLVITYSQFGYDSLMNYSCEYKMKPRMIYHGYNDKDFYVLSDEKTQEARAFNRLEDKFVFLFVGTNSTRKHPARLLEIWSQFEHDKDDCTLLMHTKVADERQGFDLREAMFTYDLNKPNIIFVKGANPIGGVPIEHINKLYNISDVFISAASCEGFGLPFLEAAACGLPSIGVDYSSIPELIKGHGELIQPVTYYHHKPLCQKRPLVDIEDFIDKMNKLYYDEELRKQYSKDCIEFAKKFTWDNFLPDFGQALEDVMAVATEKKIEKRFVEV
jgi:glycosyltransferase involved in cell wall biosynthesis